MTCSPFLVHSMAILCPGGILSPAVIVDELAPVISQVSPGCTSSTATATESRRSRSTARFVIINLCLL